MVQIGGLAATTLADRSRLTVGYGTAAVRGVVRVEGHFGLDAICEFGAAVDQLLASDVGEIWIDLRATAAVESIAAAALRRAHRRTARARVGLRLVVGERSVAHGLRRFGLADLVGPRELPRDLDHPKLVALRGAASGSSSRRPAAPSAPRPLEPDQVDLLAADPDLARGMDPLAVRVARHDLVPATVTIRRGAWRLPPGRTIDEDALGLVLEGLVVLRVGHVGAFGAQLLGPGDLVALVPGRADEASAGFGTAMRVLETVRVALLDCAFAERARDHPAVMANLARRGVAQAHAVSVGMAVAHYPRVERRLHVVLWQLAQRWGRMTQDGVVLRLSLTHAVLADLTAARRPSVTVALQRLESSGVVVRRGREWLLRDAPPAVEEGWDGTRVAVESMRPKPGRTTTP
jgi:CRP/FNR family transcriptional regulator, cyclic AMP receptor protein